jgi:hypothetical protein
MAVFLAHVETFCWRQGWDINGYITKLFLFMPEVLFWGLAGHAFFGRDLYVQAMSWSYWVTALVNVILQRIIREGPPNPSCAQINTNGAVGSFANPAWPIQLATHYIVLITVDRVYWRVRLGIGDALRLLLIFVVLPFVLVFSGNYSWHQALIGVGVGIGTGLYAAHEIIGFWMNRFADMCYSSWLFTTMGYQHPNSEIYGTVNRSMMHHHLYKQLPPEVRKPLKKLFRAFVPLHYPRTRAQQQQVDGPAGS